LNHRLDQKCHGEFLVEFHIKYEIKRTYFNMMNIIMHYTKYSMISCHPAYEKFSFFG